MGRLQDLLAAKEGRIYIRLENEMVERQFLQDAQAEGFRFADGTLPTQREARDLYALNRDGTIHFVGFVGHMAYQAADKIGGEPLVKISYRALLEAAGEHG